MSYQKQEISDKILRARNKAGKTFIFNENHDSSEPIRFWFQQSGEGLVLFVVFYTQACRWLKCLGCNLPSACSQFSVNYKNIIGQIDYVFSREEIQDKRHQIRKVIISNNGSVLDQETFSSTALMYLIFQVNTHLPNLAILSLETRVEHVEVQELEFIARGLREGDTPTSLEIAIGFEAFNDKIRNKIMRKGLSKMAIETLVADMSPYRFRLKCYLMQKPVPGMTDEEGVLDIQMAIKYLAELSMRHLDKHGSPYVPISVHLNPTYVSTGTQLERSFANGEYLSPNLYDVARSVLAAEECRLPVFIGLSDEELAVSALGASFSHADNRFIVDRLERFNHLQDFEILRALIKTEGV